MRITGGEFGGRTLQVPKSDEIRPTQDRVREALFSILQTEVPGSDFLDLFAGSGAVGLEALSRGASKATFVERNRKHLAVLARNVATCFMPGEVCLVPGAGSGRPSTKHQAPSTRHQIISADCYRWISTYSGPGFTIGFADPPYALGEERGYAAVLKTLAERGVIRSGGLFVAEMTAVQKAEETPGWDLLRDRTYGKTRLCVWRRLPTQGARSVPDRACDDVGQGLADAPGEGISKGVQQ